MATELDRLFVTLEADLTNYQAGLKRAGVDLDTFTRDTERKTGAAGKAIGDGMAKAGASVGMMNQQFTQLGYQLNDIGTSLASGASPFQVLAQQGGQVYQALAMNGGVGQGLTNVKNLLVEGATASRIMMAGLGGVAAAAIYAGFSYVGAQDDIKKGLQGIGAASGATVNDINQIAERLSAAKTISINAARDIATAIAATGKVSVGNIEGVAGLAPGFARLAGTDLETAGAQLAGLFADPVRGADEFIKKLGGINDQTRELIKNLTEQGKRQQAIVELQNAALPVIDAAQDGRSPGRRLLDTVIQRGSQALDYTGRVAAATVNPEGTEEDQLRTAQQRLAMAKQVKAAMPSLFGGEDSLANTALDALQQQVDQLAEKLRAAGEAGKRAAEQIGGAEATRNAGAILRALDPDGQRLEKAQNDLTSLGESIAKLNLDPSNANASELDKYVSKYGELKTRVDLLKEAYDKGGGAARQALAAADFSANTAGLSSYERGLRAIVQQYQEMARAAREAGNEAQAKTFEAAGARMQDSYRTQNVERARNEISIPEDYLRTIRAAESSGNDQAVSSTGAVGRYQFIRSTWLELFQDVKSSRYAEIQKANTGSDGVVDQKAVDAAVSALRNDPQLQEELVRVFSQRNAAVLDAKGGFAPTARNLYAAHNVGTGGALALLRAEREGRGGETAQSVLDPLDKRLTSANSAYYGNGKTVTEALAILERKTQANGASARAAKEDVIATDAQTAAMGRSSVEVARLKSINDDLREAREKGEEVGLRFKNADELLKASSDGLTGTLKAQTDQIIANSDARSRAVAVQLNTRFQQDQKLAREALGRTYEEQSAYSQARSYGTPGSQAFEEAKAGITEIQSLAEAKNYTSSFLKDLNRDLMQAGDLGKAALGALSNLLSRAADRGLDKIAASLFSSGGGGTGIFDMVAKFFAGGFAGGGYTGDGGRNEPAGVVHKGEVVWSQDDVRRHGGARAVDTVRRGLPGYAKGGVVAGMMAATMPAVAMPRIPAAVPARTSSPSQVDARTQNFDMRGSNFTEAQARAMFAQALAANNAENRRTFGQQLSAWKEDN